MNNRWQCPKPVTRHLIAMNTNVYNDFQREGQQQELRCQSCGSWLTREDLSCGLSLYCHDCCDEPGWMHGSLGEGGGER